MRKRPLLLACLLAVSGLVPLISRASGPGPCDGRLCAGAASADITPPVTTPMWGYTAREGADRMAGNLSDHGGAAGDALSNGDPAGAAAEMAKLANEPPASDKTQTDIEGYDKSFVANRGIHLRLQANAFVLQGSNGAKIAVVQTDLGGVPGEVHQAVADRIALTGIDREHLLIGATHTHQGPGGIFAYQGYALLGGDEFDPRVFEAVVSGITNAIVRANQTVVPAKLAWTQIATPGANGNRSSEQWCFDVENAPSCHPKSDQDPTLVPNNGANTTDSDTTVIRIDADNGCPLGVITDFAAHGTIGGDDNLLFSGDNQGWATRSVAAGIAAATPDMPAGCDPVDALINGAQGDVSPQGSNVVGSEAAGFGLANSYGRMENAGKRQAAPVLSAWQSLAGSLRDDAEVDARFEFMCFCGQAVDHPYNGPAIDQADPAWDHIAAYASLGAADITLDHGTSSPVQQPAQGHKLPAASGVGLVSNVVRMQVLRIGDVVFAGVPGEPTTTAGRRIKDAIKKVNQGWTPVIAGLANDYVSYFATPEEYTAYYYEGSFTLYGPQSVPLLTQELRRLAKAMRNGASSDTCDPSMPPGLCRTYGDNADLKTASITPVAVDTGGGAGIVTSYPAPLVQRSDVARLEWIGGGPTAEWRPDADRVVVERYTGSNMWQRIDGDASGTATTITYRNTDPKDIIAGVGQSSVQLPGEHRWTATWDVPVDATPGLYRLHVYGRWMPTLLSPQDYEVTAPFTVAAGPLAISVLENPAHVKNIVEVAYPVGVFSFRERGYVQASVDVTVKHVDGSTTTTNFALSNGRVSVPNFAADDSIVQATATDAYGNTGSLA